MEFHLNVQKVSHCFVQYAVVTRQFAFGITFAVAKGRRGEVMQGILEQGLLTETLVPEKNDPVMGTRIGIMGKLFGCWHKRLTRPITSANDSYQACLECGARRSFNRETFRTSGPFYFPPTAKQDPLT